MDTFKALAAAFVLAGFAGPAYAETKTIDLPPFTSVSIASGIDAEITVGGATQSIEAEAPSAEILNELQIRVQDGELQAWVDWNFFDLFGFGADRQLNLRIAVPALTDLESSSGADVIATGVTGDKLSFEASSGAQLTATGVSGRDFDLSASSGAGVSVEGACVTADIEASSGADINADKLLCEAVDAEASSGAHLDVFASKSIEADASSGAGIVVHGGPPTVDEETSSGGDVDIAR